MSDQRVSMQPAASQGTEVVARSAVPPNQNAAKYSPEMLQHLVDQIAGFNVMVIPDAGQSSFAIYTPGHARGVIGIRGSAVINRFAIELQPPTLEAGVRATNTVGESAGKLDLRWMVIPHDFMAKPDCEPPPTLLDSFRAQRFAMQEMTFRFGDGQDGFHSFGTGHTFPMMAGGRAKLVAAAVGNITEGFGRFRGHEGNFTLCGDLSSNRGFVGHVVVRIVDEEGHLRTRTELPLPEIGQSPDSSATYLICSAQKGAEPEQENRFSFAPDGQIRGLNIPTHLKYLHLGFTTKGTGGFRCSQLQTGEVIGEEIGFGRGSIPGAPPTGGAFNPFQFEGVAKYSFHDREKRTIGAITTNVLEGRRFDVKLQGAPEETAWRFGFFGPIIVGTGCFRGVEGMFYGASGSVLKPPPGFHVITHLYFARLNDPDGRFRVTINQVRR